MTRPLADRHASGSTASATSVPHPDGHEWDVAGEAWGRRASDWACLFEHYAIDTMYAIFRRVGVGERDDLRLLDVACGSGLAVRSADAMGAVTAGIDAAAPLIEIARRRTPHADLRVGTMFALPWDDEQFDAVTSINGVWGGCDAALVEAYRVLVPGGRIGISFWMRGTPLDLRACFEAFAACAPPANVAGMKKTNQIANPDVAETMLERAGFTVVDEGHRISNLEWPDDETAWRALASVGPAVPALDHVDADTLRSRVLDAIAGCRDATGVYRFRNLQRFVIAEKR